MSNSKILIVDDEPIGRQLLEAILHKIDYDLSFAANGLEAFEKATEIIPDLILLDVMMPEIDGYEVCKRLRNQTSTSQIPIILITALDDRDSRIRGLEAGADDYITKPLDRGEIMAKVKNITQLRKSRGNAQDENVEETNIENQKTNEQNSKNDLQIEHFILEHQRQSSFRLEEGNHFYIKSSPLKSTLVRHKVIGSRDLYVIISQEKSDYPIELLNNYFNDVFNLSVQNVQSITAGKFIKQFFENIDRNLEYYDEFNADNSFGISVCVINREDEEMQFAGINTSVLICTPSNMQQIVGIKSENMFPPIEAKITVQTVSLSENEIIFMYNHNLYQSVLESYSGEVNDNQFTAKLQQYKDNLDQLTSALNDFSEHALISNYVLMGIRF